MADRREVVVPWNAGSYRFHHWWEAALFRWLMPRWSGWSAWSVISDATKARALKPKQRKRAFK